MIPEAQMRIVIYAQNLISQQLDEQEQRFTAQLAQIWGTTETIGPALMNPLSWERRNWIVGQHSGDYEIASSPTKM